MSRPLRTNAEAPMPNLLAPAVTTGGFVEVGVAVTTVVLVPWHATQGATLVSVTGGGASGETVVTDTGGGAGGEAVVAGQ